MPLAQTARRVDLCWGATHLSLENRSLLESDSESLDSGRLWFLRTSQPGHPRTFC